MTRGSKRPSMSRTLARYDFFMAVAIAVPSQAVRFLFSHGRGGGRKEYLQ